MSSIKYIGKSGNIWRIQFELFKYEVVPSHRIHPYFWEVSIVLADDTKNKLLTIGRGFDSKSNDESLTKCQYCLYRFISTVTDLGNGMTMEQWNKEEYES